MCVRINEHTICRMWTYVLNYTCKYVQYTYNIRLRSYCIRTRRITYVHVRIRTYTHVYARIWLQRSRMLGWPEPYVNVFPMNTCRYWHPAGDTDWTYLNVYVRICSKIRTYTCSTYMYVFVIIRAYTCCTYMHVFLIEIRSVYLPKIRAHAYCHGAVTVALRSPAPAQVSALSPRGCYGKFVARQRKRMQIAKFNHIRSVRLISGSWRQLVQACPGQRSCDVGDPLLRHWSWDFSTQLHRNPSTENQRKRSWCYLNNLRMAWHSIQYIDLGISRPNFTEIQAQKINANVHGVTETIWEWHDIAYYK